ncbi:MULTISPECIES: anti-sigma factor antagonist [Bacillus]|uniref:anti-sigma factor antagonist n=1 Tax=Bacillus TaxID=1386 RepID=UPI0002FBE06D|nr:MULTISPECIES: anti-sigma factor antagonist [Bacillus]
MNMVINIEQVESGVKISISGEIDAYTAPELREKLFPLAEQASIKMTIDLTNVSYMDSTGLGVFVGAFKMVRANDGEFQIVGLSQRLKRLFDITGLTEVMQINSVETKGGLL